MERGVPRRGALETYAWSHQMEARKARSPEEDTPGSEGDRELEARFQSGHGEGEETEARLRRSSL